MERDCTIPLHESTSNTYPKTPFLPISIILFCPVFQGKRGCTCNLPILNCFSHIWLTVSSSPDHLAPFLPFAWVSSPSLVSASHLSTFYFLGRTSTLKYAEVHDLQCGSALCLLFYHPSFPDSFSLFCISQLSFSQLACLKSYCGNYVTSLKF